MVDPAAVVAKAWAGRVVVEDLAAGDLQGPLSENPTAAVRAAGQIRVDLGVDQRQGPARPAAKADATALNVAFAVRYGALDKRQVGRGGSGDAAARLPGRRCAVDDVDLVDRERAGDEMDRPVDVVDIDRDGDEHGGDSLKPDRAA
jgi:hypothetical protein